MRWQGQQLGTADDAALPGLEHLDGLVRTVTTPEFAGVTFHEVLAKSALNHVPGASGMPFDWTVNPYRGCSHACTYCLSPDTLVLCVDGRQRPIAELRIGDEIVGTERYGDVRRYVRTTVAARWTTVKRAHRVTLADGTELVASADHRFLTERGWRHVAGDGLGRRPTLTTSNRLQGLGAAGRDENDADRDEYRRGYLAGMIRHDGRIFHGRAVGRDRVRDVHTFRLVVSDTSALDRARALLAAEGVVTNTRPIAQATAVRRPVIALHTAQQESVASIERLIATPAERSLRWSVGFLAGLLDADGSWSRRVVRIAHRCDEVVQLAAEALSAIGIPFALDADRRSVRVTGGAAARGYLLALCRPASGRRPDLIGTAVDGVASLRVVSVEDLGVDMEMVDITTGTGDFVANGVVSHNCFARGTHEYLDLDAGLDFDSQIVVKVNVAEVLRTELRRGSWHRQPVMMGTNTDPYQRAEGRYRLMPDIVAAFAESGTPFSILTKGTLLRRDLPVLRDAAASVPITLAMSIAVFDDELQKVVEPGTPTTQARLDTVRAATDAGFAVTVFMMPVLPHLTDGIPLIDDALGRIRAAGAVRVVFGALHLRPGTKPWFMAWLAREHPELVSSYLGLYPGAAAYAPKAYRSWLAKRVRPLLRVHGLDGRAEEDVSYRAPQPGLAGRIVVTSRGRAAVGGGAVAPAPTGADRLF